MSQQLLFSVHWRSKHSERTEHHRRPKLPVIVFSILPWLVFYFIFKDFIIFKLFFMTVYTHFLSLASKHIFKHTLPVQRFTWSGPDFTRRLRRSLTETNFKLLSAAHSSA